MARIRSVHPGLFTDEDFVALSDSAQIFFVGLWTEADDQGVFEWKPIGLQLRLRPIAKVDIDELLSELEANDRIQAFEVGGRKYGAIRNFRRFQRPKKPNSLHPLPAEFRIYVGLAEPSSEPEVDEPEVVPNSRGVNDGEFGTGSEIAPQMEGRGRPVDTPGAERTTRRTGSGKTGAGVAPGHGDPPKHQIRRGGGPAPRAGLIESPSPHRCLPHGGGVSLWAARTRVAPAHSRQWQERVPPRARPGGERMIQQTRARLGSTVEARRFMERISSLDLRPVLSAAGRFSGSP